MASAFEIPQKTQRRGRGLLVVWQRELEKKLQINWYLPGQSRGATLEIMAEMDRRPGHRPGTMDYHKTCDNSDQDSGDTESLRTQYHPMGPHPEATPQHVPKTWSKYLGRAAPFKFETRLPSPAPSSTSSESSRPLSLESVTKPKSSYEASISSDTD